MATHFLTPGHVPWVERWEPDALGLGWLAVARTDFGGYHWFGPRHVADVDHLGGRVDLVLESCTPGDAVPTRPVPRLGIVWWTFDTRAQVWCGVSVAGVVRTLDADELEVVAADRGRRTRWRLATLRAAMGLAPARCGRCGHDVTQRQLLVSTFVGCLY